MRNNSNKKNKYGLVKKAILTLLVVVVIFGGVLSIGTKEAQAFDFNQAIFNVFKIPYDVLSRAYEYANDAYEAVGALGFKEALKKIVGNIAVDTATYLATGDKGQAPMFQTSFKDYINKEADAYLGDALNNQIRDMWGVSLCEPPDALFKVQLEIAAKEYFRAPKPQCSFTKMWANIRDPRKLQLADLPTYAEMFNPSSNELGMFLTVTTNIEEGKRKTEEEAKLLLLIEDGAKSVRSLITDNIETPAWLVKLQASLPLEWAFDEQAVFTGDLAADFIGPFANTLVSKLMKVYKEGLANDEGKATGGLGGSYGPSFGSSAIQAAREKFSNLGETEYRFGGPFDLLSQLSCENTESQYSCVIDSQLRLAIQEEPHLTVKDALDRELLHGEWAFGYRADKSGGIDDSRKSIYSHRSLIILRKYRIIPVGWELAAEYYQKYDKTGSTLTLNKLIDEYDNPDSPYYRLVDPGWVLKAPEVICEKEGPGELTTEEIIIIEIDRDQSGDITDDEKEELVIRKNYCADERSCIQESLDGQSCEYYGYCTEEKPIWRIQSENGECPAVYNSCQAYQTRNNAQVAYLNNTLWGKDICSASSVGCLEYCTQWDSASNDWACTALSSGDRMYLNNQAGDNECNRDEVGCSEFIRVAKASLVDSNQTKEEAIAVLSGPPALSGAAIAGVVDYNFSSTANLRKAPDYLGCQGYTIEIPGDEATCAGFWRTDIQKCVQSGDYKCADYALYCSSDDAGCNFYEPISYDGADVPGVAGSSDLCRQECVGYKSFMEQPSFLEPSVPLGRNPVNLIAATGKSCPAIDNGCEEFTNLGEDGQGEDLEYYSAVRSCVLPGSPNTANYYTWESTDEAGNQLRSWEMLVSNQGEWPCTNPETASDGTVSCQDGNLNPAYLCSAGNPDPNLNPVFNPDCVEFTAQSGNTYWVHFSRVVAGNNDCIPMRRTSTQALYSVSPSLSQTCAASSVGCREYKGSAANNIEIVLSDDFDSPAIVDGWNGGDLSNESLSVNGHSYLALGTIYKEVTGMVHQGRSYKLSFWAKARTGTTNMTDIYFSDSYSTPDPNSTFNTSASSVLLTDDWGYYMFDLFVFDREASSVEEYLSINSLNDFYIDNITLTETQDDVYLIQDSWVTPLSCDNPIDNPTASPATLPGEMVGCEHYKEMKSNDSWYLKSFTKLCRDEAVGCELMIDTYNTSEPEGQIFGDVIVAEDSLVYLVYDQDKLCSQAGCMSLGLMMTSRQGGISFDDKYLVVDADNFGEYNSPLCLEEEVWCDEFTPVDGGAPVYFKNPNVFTCEYKEVAGNYGWYQTGTNSVCAAVNVGINETGHCVGGRSMVNFNFENNECLNNSECVDYADFDSPGLCSGWTAVCPVSEDNCTEYQDPSSPEGCDRLSVNGEDYDANFNLGPHCDFYYYQSDKVDTTSCNGEIDPDRGCRGFHQSDGGDDEWYSTPRCSGDPSVICESDEDCLYHPSGNLGRCVYVPNTGTTYQIINTSE